MEDGTYNLYTVIHGKEREVVQRMVKEISGEIAINEYKILYSTRDLKRNVSTGNSAVLEQKRLRWCLKIFGR